MSFKATLIASPMPRGPPVTIATRAISFLLIGAATRLCAGQPACKFAADQLLQHDEAFGRIVEAIEQCEVRAAGADEGLAPADSELFERFETVGRKTGR